jgi:ribonuclease HI
MDARERTIMRAASDGSTAARRETRQVMLAAADLHAAHHFTRCASVDGSLMEEELPGGGLRRRLAYGVWEGATGGGYRSCAVAAGLSGASLAPDLEIADAELAAIHAYLRRVVAASAEPRRERVLVMSDCLGVLDALEHAWRQGDARGLRTRPRGVLLESCCVLRAQLGLVVTMYVPAHRGNWMNAAADAAAKSHLGAARDTLQDAPGRVTSRPAVQAAASDFDEQGLLLPPGAGGSARCYLYDRRLFSGARLRAARYVHSTLTAGLHAEYVDAALIGRRAHANDARSWAAVTRAVLACAKLDSHEGSEAVARMDADTSRVHTAMLARRRTAAGVAGTQDGFARASYHREQLQNAPGRHTRHMARGCAGCAPQTYVAVPEACGTCLGWRQRGRRGATNACPDCGGDQPSCSADDAAVARSLVQLANCGGDAHAPAVPRAADEDDASRAGPPTRRPRARARRAVARICAPARAGG